MAWQPPTEAEVWAKYGRYQRIWASYRRDQKMWACYWRDNKVLGADIGRVIGLDQLPKTHLCVPSVCMRLHEATGRLGDPSPAAEEIACLRLITGGTYHVYVWVLWVSDPAIGVGLWPQGCICPDTSNWVQQGSRGSYRADWVSEVRYQRGPHVFACIQVRVYEYTYIYLFFPKFGFQSDQPEMGKRIMPFVLSVLV